MIEELQHTRVFLTGFMGCGKSALGPALADLLGMRFVDLDEVIARGTGLNVAVIFSRCGEMHFRRLEAEALCATQPGCVCALGGGALMSTNNLAWALDHGVVMYLKVPVQELQRRLKADDNKRPLLQDAQGRRLSVFGQHEWIGGLLQQRKPGYQWAHITLDAAARRHEVVRDAAAALQNYVRTSLKEWR